MSFERLCDLCRKARELVKKFSLKVAAMFLCREGVSCEDALKSLVYKPI